MLGDWQECRLQEATGQLALGAKPASVALILTNDIAESCLPGGVRQHASPRACLTVDMSCRAVLKSMHCAASAHSDQERSYLAG